jgi:hypothetical protein
MENELYEDSSEKNEKVNVENADDDDSAATLLFKKKIKTI